MDRFDELSLLVAILDGGSMAAAGRKLGRSPPVVSRILADLERRVGVRLIERNTRRLAATDTGARLAERSRHVLGELEDALQEAGGATKSLQGRIRISAPLVFGRRHMLPLVLSFMDAHPEVAVDLSLADRMVDLIDENVDIALRIGQLADSSTIVRSVGSVRRVVVASPDYLRRRGSPHMPADLVRHEIILFPNQAENGAWRFVVNDREVSVRLPVRLQVDRAEAAIDAAVQGHGCLAVLSYQVADHIKAGRLVRLLRPHEGPPVPVQIVLPSSRLLAARVRAFLDYAIPRLSRLELLQEEAAAPIKRRGRHNPTIKAKVSRRNAASSRGRHR